MPVLTKPSDPVDPRFLSPASPHCPNNAPTDIVAQGKAGTCGTCAWGFYTMESQEHGPGESVAGLQLKPALSADGSTQLGYRSRCGRVRVFQDVQGRIGACRKVGGEDRFFPAVSDNWAAVRFVAAHAAHLVPEFAKSA